MIQTRIKLKFDTLANWLANDIVLLDGELAIVSCDNQIRFKIGDGTNAFSQLEFTDQHQLSTKWLAAEAISQGIHAKSVPYGFAAGAFLSANAHFSQALGYGAETISSDQYAFVWSGDSTRAIGDYYTSHGSGSFSINPADGLSGFWIGDQTLYSLLSAKQDAIVFGTTEQWKSDPSFAPAAGQLVVWTDKSTLVSTIISNDSEVELSTSVPGIKVGDGNAYNVDLPFAGDDIADMLLKKLVEHEQLSTHLSAGEREMWNHKISLGDISDPNDDGVSGETLVITRN